LFFNKKKRKKFNSFFFKSQQISKITRTTRWHVSTPRGRAWSVSERSIRTITQ